MKKSGPRIPPSRERNAWNVPRNSHNNSDQANSQVTNRKFEEACAKIQASIEKFIPDGGDEDLSSSEEELEEDNILHAVFKSYNETEGGGGDVSELNPMLVESLKSGSLVCLICIESVKRADPIWSCSCCYCSFHLSCIQKWSKDSIFFYSQAIEDQSSKDSLTWCCPKCRKEYNQNEFPSEYRCFCKKEKDPPFQIWQVPHSCGQLCGRPLIPECGHQCTLLCHPGPCPPCPKVVHVTCHCGKQKPISRRCNSKNWSCSKPCGKLLSCLQHKCAQLCHTGECEPCPRKSLQKCLCGRNSTYRPCASPKWQCEEICGKNLSCGHHICEVVCHSGDCAPCPRSGKRPCPCGKNSVELPCTEDVPTCGDTCEKLLECGFHRCVHQCHYGQCGKCLQMRIKRCRCGLKEKSVPCCKEYTCEVKCKRIRDCGKHACNRKCCDGNCSKCEQPCGKTLACRNHKCTSRCHQGRCYPCSLTVTISCNCGATKRVVPCGRERVTKPPHCNKSCKKPPDCHHQARDKHRCHSGYCPPCRQVCGKAFERCGHTCPKICHTAVLTKIETKGARAGPWEPIEVRYELVDKLCPPCQVPVSVRCLGEHEITSFPCSEARPFFCGRACGRKLPCGNHACTLPCHEVLEAPSGEQQVSTPCELCEEACSKPRPEGCAHRCLLPCHPDPCPECKQSIRVQCHCRLSTLYVICKDWTGSSEDERDKLKSCKNRCPKLMECSHRCPLTCHSGPCATQEACKKKVTIRCSCKRLKKEVTCNSLIDKLVNLECDDICKKLIEEDNQRKLQERQKREEQEKLKQQQELEDFLRKQERKKSRQRKVKEGDTKQSWCSSHKMHIIMAAVSAGVSILVFLLIGAQK